jgi:rare lipoprotein A
MYNESRIKNALLWSLLIILVASIHSCNMQKAHSAEISAPVETASWYSTKSCQKEGTSGALTASGKKFDENAPTCAMRSRDFGKYYRITNLDNGKSVVVCHTDFGPNKKLWDKGRKVDLSKGAFRQIADLRKGIINVKIEAL